MGTSTEGSGEDPASDDRSRYDYQAGDVERPGFVRDLRERVDGDVRFDDLTRELYATDASAYEVTPIGVVFPDRRPTSRRSSPTAPSAGRRSSRAAAAPASPDRPSTRPWSSTSRDTWTRCSQWSRIPGSLARRPASSLADLKRTPRRARPEVCPRPRLGRQERAGGAIGNNSTGSHSLKYGKTDAYVEECEVVLADGTVTTFGEVTLAELRERAADDTGESDVSGESDDPAESDDLEARIYAAVARIVDEEADAVAEAFPDLKRNVSGYNLDRLVEEAESGSVNLARLLAGSEGTLAVVTEATVSLEPVPATKALALLAYEDLVDAMRDVPPSSNTTRRRSRCSTTSCSTSRGRPRSSANSSPRSSPNRRARVPPRRVLRGDRPRGERVRGRPARGPRRRRLAGGDSPGARRGTDGGATPRLRGARGPQRRGTESVLEAPQERPSHPSSGGPPTKTR